MLDPDQFPAQQGRELRPLLFFRNSNPSILDIRTEPIAVDKVIFKSWISEPIPTEEMVILQFWMLEPNLAVEIYILQSWILELDLAVEIVILQS